MNSSLWYDLKLKFFKSGNPTFLYIGINIVVFIIASLIGVVSFFVGKDELVHNVVREYLAIPADLNQLGSHFYTIITHQFFHADILHLFYNMVGLYYMGSILIDFIKPRQFHLIYLGGGVLGGIFFVLIYNLVPVYRPSVPIATAIGASAAVMAIFSATATLVPNYTVRFFLIGDVNIKYLLIAYIFLDIVGTTAGNSGGSIAHLGGVLFGFAYIKILQNGIDLSMIFKRKPKMKVVRNEKQKKQEKVVNQKEIDTILDKISKSGYDKLSSQEKQVLFDASKN